MAGIVPTSIGSYVMPRSRPSPPRFPRPVTQTNGTPPGTAAPVNPLAGILTNPLVVQAQQAQQQTLGDSNALLGKQYSQALINYGSPELANDPKYRDMLDPNTATAAGANQFSTLANLAHQNELGRRSILNSLAAHGLIHSGDVGYREGEQARAFGQAGYDATQNLLSQLSSYLNQYLGANQQANNGYTNALLQGFGLYGQNPLGLLG